MAKKSYPFNWRSFAWRTDGISVAGCKNTPSCAFTPTEAGAKNPAIYFNGYFNHEKMDKPFSQQFTFDDFRYFLNVLKAVAHAPGEGQIIKKLACKYFKDGEFKFGGVSVGIVRNEKGLIYFAFKNKNIPTIQFPMLPKGSLEQQNKDGELEDVREVSKMATISFVERNIVMLNKAIEDSIETETAAKSGGNSGGYGGGNSYTSNSSSSSDDSGGEEIDFSEDIPF